MEPLISNYLRRILSELMNTAYVQYSAKYLAYICFLTCITSRSVTLIFYKNLQQYHEILIYTCKIGLPALMEDCMLAVDGIIIQRIKPEQGQLISIGEMLDIRQNLCRCRSQSALIARKYMIHIM